MKNAGERLCFAWLCRVAGGDTTMPARGGAGVGIGMSTAEGGRGGSFSEFRTGGYEGFAVGVGLEFLEVLDKHAGELLCLLCPFGGVGVGVAGVEDLRVYSGKLGGDHEVEDREHFCRGFVDVTVEDVVDDATGVAD